MTANLVDVVMLTGFNISHPVTSFRLLDPVIHKLLTRDVGVGKNISPFTLGLVQSMRESTMPF